MYSKSINMAKPENHSIKDLVNKPEKILLLLLVLFVIYKLLMSNRSGGQSSCGL